MDSSEFMEARSAIHVELGAMADLFRPSCLEPCLDAAAALLAIGLIKIEGPILQ